jgi:probable F420-dependent oxidoreductase
VTGRPSVGLDVSTSAAPGADPVSDARQAERLGFDFVSISDHLHGTTPTYETWTLLTWLAAATSRIGLATRVLAAPYRHPAVVAKMAETLDRLSGGRVILGVGGGYSDEEFRGFGVGERSPRDKVDGLEEAIRIARGVWSEPAFTYQGRLYRTERAELSPKPARRIPIWLGTYGKRALAVTGRLADGWIPSLGFAPPEQAIAMRERVLAAAREAGRDPAELTCAYNVAFRIDEATGSPAASPAVVSGSAEQVAQQLRDFVAMGFDALNLNPAGPGRRDQVDQLAADVLPALRAGAGRA